MELGEGSYIVHHLPPQWGIRDILWYPWLSAKSYVARMSRVFGWRLLVYLIFTQLFLKGIAHNIIMDVVLPLYKNVLGVDAGILQLHMMMAMIPWSLKPLMGLASDLFTVCGYHKRPWLLLGLLVGCASSGAIFAAYITRSVIGITLCVMGVQMQIAIFDLMTEGAYSALMRDHPYTGSDMVIFAQGMQSGGAILAALISGILSDVSAYYPMLIMVAVLCASPVIPTLLGWIGEQRTPPPPLRPRCCVERTHFHEEGGRIFVICFAGIAAPITAFVANNVDTAYGLAVAGLMSVATMMGAFFAFPPLIARLALFQVVASVSRPSMGRALEYFYTASEQCVPGGPHFSYSYYIGVAGIVSSVAMLCATFLYTHTLSGMRYRRVFIVTTLLRCLAGCSDFWIVKRWNVKMGISDSMAYLLGEAIFEPVVGMLGYIPAVSLISKIVSPGMESSVYAFMAGTYNFGSLTASLGGELIYETAGVVTSGEQQCDFSGLATLVMICHVALPTVFTLGFVWLIPDALQTESLLLIKEEKGDGDAKFELVLPDASDTEEIELI